MKIGKLLHMAMLTALLGSAAAIAQTEAPPAPPAGLSVLVSGLSQAGGTVEVSLFDSPDTFLKEPYRQESGQASEDGQLAVEFLFLSAGEYAVVVVHDANDNGQLDAGFLGFGGEQYGFSNNVRPWFGRPDFDQAKFSVGEEGALIEINLD